MHLTIRDIMFELKEILKNTKTTILYTVKSDNQLAHPSKKPYK